MFDKNCAAHLDSATYIKLMNASIYETSILIEFLRKNRYRILYHMNKASCVRNDAVSLELSSSKSYVEVEIYETERMTS